MTAIAEQAAAGVPIVEAIAEAKRRQRITYRILFAGTWLVIVGLLVLGLTSQFNWAFLQEWWGNILYGAQATILLTVISITLACILALLGALGRLSRNPVLNGIASLYVSVIRGTPLIVQIFIWTYALAEWGLVLPLFWCGIIALGVNYGAYMTEVFRAGIQAVPPGQREAAQALGMPSALIMRRIVLPQAIRIVVPAIGNDFIAMIKDTALVYAIGIQELLLRANNAGRSTVNVMEALLFAALIYWIMTIVFSFFQRRLELRFARSDR